jgi:CheY-like chemotaxis protein
MRESLGRGLQGIAQSLDSCDGSEARIFRVLEQLREIVAFEQCALLRIRPGRQPQLFVVPRAPAEARVALSDMLVHLHLRLVDERARPREPCAPLPGAHLAVPLVGDDRTIGVLMVRGATSDAYTAQHLRELAIVGSQLAAYLVMVDQASQLDDARRQAEAAARIKDEFLATVSSELRSPLKSVLDWARSLREDTGPHERTLAIEAIERNVRAQERLIHEVLDLSTRATAVRSHLARAAVIGPPDQLVADPVRIVTVISNLLLTVIRSAPSLRVDHSESRTMLSGIRVLLVDDDAEMREAAAAVLELHGAEVTAVASAAAALAALAQVRPHVLLSDLMLAGSTGYDLIREVSARNVVVPAAAVTSLARDEDRRSALAAGFTMHLTKPFHAQELVAAVATLARSAQALD